MKHYRCLNCCWMEEIPQLPPKCRRCGDAAVEVLSKEAFLLAWDNHDVKFCEACEKVHTR
jgi:hypothetical protein